VAELARRFGVERLCASWRSGRRGSQDRIADPLLSDRRCGLFKLGADRVEFGALPAEIGFARIGDREQAPRSVRDEDTSPPSASALESKSCCANLNDMSSID
jgi:hypothetical protein